MEKQSSSFPNSSVSHKRASLLHIWGLAFGCVIGWGCFVMPGTTFLPDAGFLGTAVGILIAAGVIVVVTVNYSSLAKRFPEAPGSYGYVRNILGND